MLSSLLALIALLSASGAHAFEVAYNVPGGSEFQGIAVSGPNLLVADTVDGDRFESDAGIVSVYDRATGLLRGTLPNPDGDGGFGRSLTANDRWTAVSALGGVHVFDNRGEFVRSFRSDAPEHYDFGLQVALSADRLLVSDDWTPASVHVFDVTTGAVVQTLPRPDGIPKGYNPYDPYTALAVAGDLAIVSSPMAGVVCALDITTSIERWCVSSPRRQGNDFFGSAMSVDGDDLIVGAPGPPYAFAEPHQTPGNAYLLDAETGSVRRRYKGLTPGSAFGTAVAVKGNRILVGAPNPAAKATRSGKAYLLAKSSGRILHTFRSPRNKFDIRTGAAVAFIASRIAVVDLWDDSEKSPVIRVFR